MVLAVGLRECSSFLNSASWAGLSGLSAQGPGTQEGPSRSSMRAGLPRDFCLPKPRQVGKLILFLQS